MLQAHLPSASRDYHRSLYILEMILALKYRCHWCLFNVQITSVIGTWSPVWSSCPKRIGYYFLVWMYWSNIVESCGKGRQGPHHKSWWAPVCTHSKRKMRTIILEESAEHVRKMKGLHGDQSIEEERRGKEKREKRKGRREKNFWREFSLKCCIGSAESWLEPVIDNLVGRQG